MNYEIIKALGPKNVADALGLSQSAVSDWSRNGIAHRHRVKVADMAKAAGIDVPHDFHERAL